jgi:hypothetical protein
MVGPKIEYDRMVGEGMPTMPGAVFRERDGRGGRIGM